MKNRLLTLMLTVAAAVSVSAKPYSIVPVPTAMKAENGTFSLSKKTPIVTGNEGMLAATYLQEAIKTQCGFDIQINPSKTENPVKFTIDKSAGVGKEGYSLDITGDKIEIKAEDAAGLFYGVQTLIQILPQGTYKASHIALEGVSIKDTPRFAWRGLMLDCSRHFFEVDFIKKLLDNLALHKINTFHWHLTDDQGWRIEIKQFPKLTEIGAYRKETIVGHMRYQNQEFDGERHGGYYTQDQVRDLVKYAADRYITIVPEIEIPGHAQAAIAAYPEFGSTDEKDIEVSGLWGVMPYLYNPYDPTFDFLEKVLEEVIDLFPSEYIHIGGDEAVKDQWKANRGIQKKIKELGLKNEDQLQSWYIKRIQRFVESKGRKIIGWDEITEGGAPNEAGIMYWRSWVKSSLEEAVVGNHPIVSTPTATNYLDYRQMEDAKGEPLAIGNGIITLEKCYTLEPVPSFATPEQAKNVIGTQGNMWTEYVKTPEHAEYMIFPRIAAIAECAWSEKEAKNYQDFVGRMRVLAKIYEQRGINYCGKSLQ